MTTFSPANSATTKTDTAAIAGTVRRLKSNIVLPSLSRSDSVRVAGAEQLRVVRQARDLAEKPESSKSIHILAEIDQGEPFRMEGAKFLRARIGVLLQPAAIMGAAGGAVSPRQTVKA